MNSEIRDNENTEDGDFLAHTSKNDAVAHSPKGILLRL